MTIKNKPFRRGTSPTCAWTALTHSSMYTITFVTAEAVDHHLNIKVSCSTYLQLAQLLLHSSRQQAENEHDLTHPQLSAVTSCCAVQSSHASTHKICDLLFVTDTMRQKTEITRIMSESMTGLDTRARWWCRGSNREESRLGCMCRHMRRHQLE